MNLRRWIHRQATRLWRDDGGQVALIFALGLPALTLLGAGAIDLMNVTSARARVQDIADAAALAGANELSLAIDDDVAVSRARTFVDTHLAEWKNQPKIVQDITVIEQDKRRVVQVKLDGNSRSFFGNLLPPGGWNYKAVSQAVAVGEMPLCVLVTAGQKDKVLNIKDQGRLQAPACLVHSNRDILVEGGQITAAAVQAVTSARGMISPVAGTGAASIADPFVGINLQEKQPCTILPDLGYVLTGTVRLRPGVHCGGYKVGGTANLILEPGEHWFLGGHLEVKENARLTGVDVVLIFDQKSKFDFKDQALVNLDGRKSGAYAGMVMVATRGNIEDFVITSNNVDRLLGVIYVPEARLVIEGKSTVARDSAWTVIVARMLQLKGSPSLIINANYSASDVPVPTGVGPRAGGSRLVQ